MNITPRRSTQVGFCTSSRQRVGGLRLCDLQAPPLASVGEGEHGGRPWQVGFMTLGNSTTLVKASSKPCGPSCWRTQRTSGALRPQEQAHERLLDVAGWSVKPCDCRLSQHGVMAHIAASFAQLDTRPRQNQRPPVGSHACPRPWVRHGDMLPSSSPGEVLVRHGQIRRHGTQPPGSAMSSSHHLRQRCTWWARPSRGTSC